jgi:hypothetical protein
MASAVVMVAAAGRASSDDQTKIDDLQSSVSVADAVKERYWTPCCYQDN